MPLEHPSHSPRKCPWNQLRHGNALLSSWHLLPCLQQDIYKDKCCVEKLLPSSALGHEPRSPEGWLGSMVLCPRKSSAEGEKAGQGKPRVATRHALESQKLHGQQTGAVLQPTVPEKAACASQPALAAPGSWPAPPRRPLQAVYPATCRTDFLFRPVKGFTAPLSHLHR